MVGDSVLREVVGSDFFTSVAGANLGFSLGSEFFLFFCFYGFHYSGTEDLHGFFFVLHLASFVLAGYDGVGWQVSDTNGTVCCVNALASVSASAEGIDAKVVWVDF